MDRDIHELNRTFLFKAREFAMTHGDDRAHYVMGISRDMAEQLRKLSLVQLNALADSNITCFTLRIPASLLRQLESLTDGGTLGEFGQCQIVASTLKRDSDAAQY